MPPAGRSLPASDRFFSFSTGGFSFSTVGFSFSAGGFAFSAGGFSFSAGGFCGGGGAPGRVGVWCTGMRVCGCDTAGVWMWLGGGCCLSFWRVGIFSFLFYSLLHILPLLLRPLNLV